MSDEKKNEEVIEETAGAQAAEKEAEAPQEEKKEKAKKDAYNKWQKERESHKKLVPEQGHYEDVYESVKVKDAWDEQVTKERKVVDREAYDETAEDGTVIHHDEESHMETYTETIHHDAVYENRKTGTRWVVDVPAHYEYEKGYRDGDFHYKN